LSFVQLLRLNESELIEVSRLSSSKGRLGLTWGSPAEIMSDENLA